MMVMACVWAASWLILGAAGLLPDSLAAAIGVLAFMGVFAFGETLLQPTVPAIYNDLASDHNRGRYNAINSAAFQGGAITGPIAAGLLLDQGLDARVHRRHGRRLPRHRRAGLRARTPHSGERERRAPSKPST